MHVHVHPAIAFLFTLSIGLQVQATGRPVFGYEQMNSKTGQVCTLTI
jgi:hypothetical protein